MYFCLIGGSVLAFFICVVSCVIRKHWKQRGVTNPVNPSKESGTSLHENAPVGELIENKLWTDAMHSQNPPSSGLSCTGLNEFKSQHASGVSDGAHDLQNHEAELEGSCQERDGIRLCKTAPGTLPAAGVVHQVTTEKTQIVNDTKSIGKTFFLFYSRGSVTQRQNRSTRRDSVALLTYKCFLRRHLW